MSTKLQSPLDRALALCPSDSARLELTRLGAELNLGTSSPEWIIVVLYAEARGLFAVSEDADRTEVLTRLERIEARVKRGSAPGMQVDARPMRDIVVFTAAILLCTATAVLVGVAEVPWVRFVAAFGLGLCVALIYPWCLSATVRK